MMMNWNSLNLEEALNREKEQSERKNPDTILAEFKALLEQDDQLDEAIIRQIFSGDTDIPELDYSLLDPSKIYTEAQIKSLCTRYRLRFLSAKYFKGEIPHEGIAKVKRLQKQANADLTNFKIVAPAPMFNLQQRDKDPLLMLALGNGRYYLVHKWGNDLNRFRRWMVMPFRNFKSLISSVALLALTVVLCIPDSIIMGPYDQSSAALRVIFFFYLFIAFSGLTALYGFSRMKNFNENLWNSKYLD